jgi:hypothetical protein
MRLPRRFAPRNDNLKGYSQGVSNSKNKIEAAPPGTVSAGIVLPSGDKANGKQEGKTMSKVEEILEKIEDLRQELVALETAKGTSDPEVLKASMQLNGVLNEYYRLLKEKMGK